MEVFKILKNKVASTTPTTPDPTPTPDPITQTSSSEYAPDDTMFAVNIINKRVDIVIGIHDIKNIHNESISDGFEHLEFIATESNISEDILKNANRALRMLLATKDEVND